MKTLRNLFARLSDFFDFLRALCEYEPPKRLDVAFVSYADAEKLLASKTEHWEIAKEEDENHNVGFVWLERLELPSKFPVDEHAKVSDTPPV